MSRRLPIIILSILTYPVMDTIYANRNQIHDNLNRPTGFVTQNQPSFSNANERALSFNSNTDRIFFEPTHLSSTSFSTQSVGASNTDDITQSVIGITTNILGAKGIDENTSFNEIDSLDTVELIMALEQAFDIQIPNEEAENMTTVGDAVAYINSYYSD